MGHDEDPGNGNGDGNDGEFLWGTSTSGHQVEEDLDDDWTVHERRFTPAGRACAFREHFEADLDLARELGTNAFRFSLEWSRIEPAPGQRDPAAIRFYERLIEACHARGLEPIVTLHHFTLPRWCAGGWLAAETLEAWSAHVAWVAERFGERVRWWVTINEPNVQAAAGYVAGVFAPGRRFRPDLAGRCLVGLVRAHARAFAALREAAARRGGPTPRIAISPNLVAFRPTRWTPLVRGTCERFDWAVLDCLSDGERGGRLALELGSAAIPEAKGTLDVVGVNYFMGLDADPLSLLRLGGLLARPAGPGTSDMGWPIDADGFERILLEAWRRYGRPLLVTENGIADASDSLRPTYLRDHVAAMRRAIARGADVRGYSHWSLLDNFEWHEGYGPRFGLVAVDYVTQRRTPRPSFDVYRALIAAAPVATAGTPLATTS